MLPELARGDANTVFVIPSEFTQAFADIGGAVSRRLSGVPANGAKPGLPLGPGADGEGPGAA